MEYLIVALVTASVSALTFLSGFGLGTLLLPVFIVFFPVDVAIAATAIVHLANNIFKALLVGKKANWGVLKRFAIPAVAGAILGAYWIGQISHLPVFYQYEWMGQVCSVTPIKLIVAVLMLTFALMELLPQAKMITFNPRYVPLGGIITGFFGGLTGHQGALRSAFLVRLGLDKEVFIGTAILSAIAVDVSRLAVYGVTFIANDLVILQQKEHFGLIITGIVSAFIGAIAGYYIVKKVTLTTIHRLMGVLLVGYAVALGVGWL